MTEQNTTTTTTTTSELLQQATAGNAKAQFKLALYYAYGKYVNKSQELALEWLKKSAEQGYIEAQFALGMYYFFDHEQFPFRNKMIDQLRTHNTTLAQKLAFHLGTGDIDFLMNIINNDYSNNASAKLAFKWFKQSAKQNYAESYYWLGICYQNGKGTESNVKLAFSNFKQSAKLEGYAEAYYALAHCYHNSIGTEQNYELAFHWITKATETEKADLSPEAYLLLGDLYANGLGVQQNDKLAFKWYEKVAKWNYPKEYEGYEEEAIAKAAYYLAQCYEYGRGIERSVEQASKYYNYSRDIDAETQFRMANYYLSGKGVKQDYNEGMIWMVAAIEAGHTEADQIVTDAILSMLIPTSLLDKGVGDRCYKYIFDWCIQEKNDRNEMDANFFLGFLYYSGRGVEQNDELAFKYFTQACSSYRTTHRNYSGDSDGDGVMYELCHTFICICYALGKGVKKDVKKASTLQKCRGQLGELLKGKDASYYHDGYVKMFLILLQSNLFILAKEYDLACKHISESVEKFNGDEQIFKNICLRSIEQERELDKKNQELEAKNQELEDMMSMFAHKFRSPLDAIIYNTTHENNPKLYIEAAQSMRGLLDIFSIISTDDKILTQRIIDDSQGCSTPTDLFSNNLNMILLHFLSASSTEKIRQHYISYAKTHSLCDADVSLKVWNEEYFELEQSLQLEWEQSYSSLLIQSAPVEQRTLWVEEHFFKLELQGFSANPVNFQKYASTESFLTIILNEILVNAFKYYASDSKQAVSVKWEASGEDQILSCSNPSTRFSRSRIKGSSKGHTFLSALAHKTGCEFNKPELQDNFIVEFKIPNQLLLS